MYPKCVLSFLLIPALLAPALLAQTYTGSIGGRVTDTSGAIVPRAEVTLIEEATNTTLKTVTGDTGDYMLSFLKPGSYRIQFASPVFREHVESGVQLQINQNRRVDPVLELGQLADTIQV